MNKIFIILCTVLLFSCKKNNETPPEPAKRTVIVYMVGDNTLSYEVATDINEMEEGWKNEYDGNLIVYVDQKRVAPYVLKIQNDRTSNVVSTEVIKYAEQNSSSVEVMDKVLTDIKAMYPAESYGLILWSHASGWLPKNSFTRAFGDDNGEGMDITEMSEISGKYDFILFDACNMAGVETAYELRNNADYIVASAAEVLYGGYPYQRIVNHLFKEKADLVSTAEEFMAYYRSFDSKEMRSATMSVIDTKALTDLASISKVLIQKYKGNIGGLNLSKIQKYDSYNKTLFFDFKDYIDNIVPADDPNLQLFHNQLNLAVLFKDHTPTMLNFFDIDRSCGLSCYIPGRTSFLDNAYANMAWYNAVYL